MSLVGRLSVAVLPDTSSFASTASKAIAAGMRRETRSLERVSKTTGEAMGDAMGDAAGSNFDEALNSKVRAASRSIVNHGAPMGRALGDEAGDAAGRSMMDGIDEQIRQATPRLRDARGRFVGREVGDAAGEEAGRTMIDGINDHVQRSGARLRDSSGRYIGRNVGEGAGTAAGLAMATGIESDMNGRVPVLSRIGNWMGQGMGIAAGAAFAVVFSTQIGDVIDFDKQRTIVNTLLGGDAAAEQWVSDTMKTAVRAFGSTSETAGQAMFAGISAQFSQEDIELLTNASFKISWIAGDPTQADEIASQAQNIIKLNGAEFGGVTGVLDVIAQGGAQSATDAAGMIGGMVGIDQQANMLGISLDQLVGSMATLNNTGATMGMVNTMSKNSFSELLNSTSNVNKIFADLTGGSAKDFLAQGGSLTEMVQILADGSKELGYDLGSVFSTNEADQWFSSLLLKMPEFEAAVASMSDSAGVLDKQFEPISNSPGFLWAQVLGNIRYGLITVKDALRPLTVDVLRFALVVLGNVGPALRAMRDWLKDAYEAVSDFVDRVADWLEQYGLLEPVLIGVGVAIGTLLLPVVVILVGAMISLAWAAASAVVSFTALVGPFIIGAAVVAAFVAAIVWAYQNIGWFRDSVNAVRDVIVDQVWPALQAVAAWLASTFVAAWQAVSSYVVDTLWPALQEIAAWLGDVFAAAWEGISTFVTDTLLPAMQDMGDWFESDFMPVLEDLGGHVQDLWTDMSEFGTAVATVATQVWSVLGPAIIAAAGWFGGNLVPILQFAWTFISTVFTPMWNTLAVGVQVAWGLIQIVVGVAWLFIQGIFLLIGAGIDILGLLFDGLAILVTAGWTAIHTKISEAWGIIQTVWGAMQTAWDALVTAYQVGKDNLLGFIGSLQTGFEDAFGAIRDAVQWPIDKVNDLIDAIGRIDFPDAPSWLSGAGRFLGLDGSSEGRLVTRPMVSMLGEGGLPEVVLPLTKPGRMKALLSGPAGAIVAANLPQQYQATSMPDAWSRGSASGGGDQIVINGYSMETAYEMASNRLSRKATLTVRRG